VEKIIYLFQRKDGLTREECFDHYRDVHAPLGMRVVKTMAGYTVNLTDLETPPSDAPDAITETWTPSIEASLDPEQNFASRDDAAELWADHKTFLNTQFDTYIVEERITQGELPPTTVGTRTPGVKCIVLQGPGEPSPPIPEGATCVQVNEVLKVMSSGSPPLERITAIWAPDAETLGPSSPHAFLTSEYRFLVPRS
jgi:hypothetical protein